MKYNGIGDPREHLSHYKSSMELQRASDAMHCRAFVLTLSGLALTWYNKLENGSIVNFTQLSRSFLSNLHRKMRIGKSALHLYSIRQGPNESLESYTKRFQDASLEVEGVGDEEIIRAYMHGLNKANEKLFYALIEYNPK